MHPHMARWGKLLFFRLAIFSQYPTAGRDCAETQTMVREIGVECPGFAEERTCCDVLPMQRVIAWLQYSMTHDEQHLASFSNILAQVENTLKVFASGAGDNNCIQLIEQMLTPRVEAAKMFAQRASVGLKLVEHLTSSKMCYYCFREEEEAPFRITMQDGPAAEQLSALGAETQWTQRTLLHIDAELLRLDPERRCIPEYLAVLNEGAEVSDGVGMGEDITGNGGSSAKLSFEMLAATMSSSVQAVARLRDWPFDRRSFSESMPSESSHSFDEDLIEVAERLQSYLLGPPSRMAHQAQTLALTLDKKFHWSSTHPLAQLLWEKAIEIPSSMGSSTSTRQASPTPSRASAKERAVNKSVAEYPNSADYNVGEAMGIVLLVSNRTTRKTVDELLLRLGGPHTLFLEDVCGDALEALGYGCHGGGDRQSKCLTPVHTTHIAEFMQNHQEKLKPRTAWRRHGATRSIAHAAWELGTSYWGADAQIWLADLRPACSCLGSAPLKQVLESTPHMRMQIVSEPRLLWGLDASQLKCSDSVDISLDWLTSPYPFAESPLSSRLADYIAIHEVGVAAISKHSLASATMPRVLVYSCQPFAQCGGHGDRLNGIVTAFFLAVLTNRVFLIDSESPLPLQMLLEPALIDWRVRGNIMAGAGLRHHSYHDKRRQFEADIGRLAAYPDNVLVVTKNYRMLRSLFEAPALRDEVTKLGLPIHAPKFLVAEVFDVLFRPSPILQRELIELRRKLGLQDRNFIGIHLRTGNIAWDPARHGVSELSEFLECAKKAEQELGLPEDSEIPWLLATDSAAVAEAAVDLPEARSGKLKVPSANGRIHIDRSEMADVLEGTVANYAEYLLFGEASAVVLSRSFFGETAAEIGRVPNAYFAPGGGCPRVDLSSS